MRATPVITWSTVVDTVLYADATPSRARCGTLSILPLKFATWNTSDPFSIQEDRVHDPTPNVSNYLKTIREDLMLLLFGNTSLVV